MTIHRFRPTDDDIAKRVEAWRRLREDQDRRHAQAEEALKGLLFVIALAALGAALVYL